MNFVKAVLIVLFLLALWVCFIGFLRWYMDTHVSYEDDIWTQEVAKKDDNG